MSAVLAIGDVAALLSERCGCRIDTWKIRACIARGFISEPPRVGIARAWAMSELPKLERALRRAGYLPAEVPA